MPKIWDSVDERRAYNRSRYHAEVVVDGISIKPKRV